MGGSPCRGLSGANPNRKGLHDAQSTFDLHIPRLLEIIRVQSPSIVLELLLENVASMRLRDRRIFAEMLGVTPILVQADRVTRPLGAAIAQRPWSAEEVVVVGCRLESSRSRREAAELLACSSFEATAIRSHWQ